MKSPKNFPTAPNHAAQKPRHSSLLLWAVLIMVMLSGLVYLGAKVKELRMAKPLASQSSTPSQQDLSGTISSNLQKNVPLSFDQILTTLKSQQLLNPVIYKSQLILNNDESTDATQNHETLWQSGQKQLTLIKATVYAGVNLSELTPQSLSLKSPVTLSLPPARITVTQIDKAMMYDVKTGQPSTVQMGLSFTNEQENKIKAQIEREFCHSEVLQSTTEDTRQHVISLLNAMGVSIVVRVAEPIGCQKTAS